MRKWARVTRNLKAETYAIYLAMKHPRTPWFARAVAACVVAYALSPIDLIPDPIPLLGYLDDLVLVPLGVALVVRLIPVDVMAECRGQAEEMVRRLKPKLWIAGAVVVATWVVLLLLVVWAVLGLLGHPATPR